MLARRRPLESQRIFGGPCRAHAVSANMRVPLSVVQTQVLLLKAYPPVGRGEQALCRGQP